jgi:hypothetical protein
LPSRNNYNTVLYCTSRTGDTLLLLHLCMSGPVPLFLKFEYIYFGFMGSRVFLRQRADKPDTKNRNNNAVRARIISPATLHSRYVLRARRDGRAFAEKIRFGPGRSEHSEFWSGDHTTQVYYPPTILHLLCSWRA